MKILVGLETFYPNYRAGTETYALNLARSLRDIGIEVEFLTPLFDGQAAAFDYESFKIRCFPAPREATAKQMNGLLPPSGFSAAMEEIKQSAPDIFHLQSLTKSFSGLHLKAVKEMGIKTVLTPHMAINFCVRGDLRYHGRELCDGHVRSNRCLECYSIYRGVPEAYAKYVAGIINFLIKIPLLSDFFPASFHLVKFKLAELRRTRDYCDMVVALSPWIEKLLQKNGITKTRLVKQGASPYFDFAKHICRWNQEGEKLKVGYVGRAYHIKGLHWFLDAADNLREENMHFHVVLGAHPDQKYYHDQYNRATTMPFVTWEENLNQEEVCQRMGRWDVLCVPSASEVAPLVMYEASACGLPVVGSDIPAISDHVEDGINGCLFPAGDASALSVILRRLAADHSLLLKLRAGIGTPRYFEHVATEMAQIYRRVLMADSRRFLHEQ